MTFQLELRAFAKVNLVLEVLGPREDGFTEIATVFQTVGLHDDVRLEWEPGKGAGRVLLEACGRPVDCPPEQNLAVRAAETWLAARGRGGTVRIGLEKRIPAQAGLGGGSADAAAVLVGLDRLDPSPDAGAADPARLAAELGSDVPFLVTGGTALGEGRGERLSALTELPPRAVVLARSEPGLSTAEVYRRARTSLTPQAGTPNIHRFLQYLREGASGRPPLENDLLKAAGGLHAPMLHLLGLLASLGAASTMSGSGSAVFGLFPDRARAENAATRLREDASRPWVAVTETLDRKAVKRLRVVKERQQGED